jgi:hypothetical protein
MLRKIYIPLFFSLLFSFSVYAQNALDHSTGVVDASVFDDGFVGHRVGGEGGVGYVYMGGNDAMWVSAFVMGNSDTKASGYSHHNSVSFNDLTNVTPFSGFTSNSDFNQIAQATFTDGNAPLANQLGLMVHQISYSNTNDPFVIIQYVLENQTGSDMSFVYAGVFADWDVGVNNYTINQGGYDAARNLAYQYENGGAVDSNYYGIVALDGWSGARVTADNVNTEAALRDSIYSYITTFLNESITTDDDYRTWIGSGPLDIPNGGTARVGFAYVVGGDLTELKANTDLAQSKWDNQVVPVELSSFTAISQNGVVELNWTTASEVNNRIFEIERKPTEGKFVTIGYVEGNGTTSEEKHYSFTDKNVSSGIFTYRLKQIDFNGQFEYSNEVKVNVTGPLEYSLGQNYPNPFNPITTIKYSVPEAGNVKLSIYNLLGEELTVLVKGYKEAGLYELNFNASGLPSGTYIYRLEATPSGGQAGSFVETRKMILLK